MIKAKVMDRNDLRMVCAGLLSQVLGGGGGVPGVVAPWLLLQRG